MYFCSVKSDEVLCFSSDDTSVPMEKEQHSPQSATSTEEQSLLKVNTKTVVVPVLSTTVVLIALVLWTSKAQSAAVPEADKMLFARRVARSEAVLLPRDFGKKGPQVESYWRTPCGATTFGPIQKAPTWAKLRNLLNEISMRAGMVSQEAEQRKNQFLEAVYNDTEYENIYRHVRHDWLPSPPSQEESQGDFVGIDIETAFRRVYGYLQHYAVGLEQATLDQMFTHEGKFANLFRDVQNSLKQLLCDFDLSIHSLNIRKDADVLRGVMSMEQRKFLGEHKLTLRDYMILRDYIQMVRYVHKLFIYLSRHPEKSPPNVVHQNRSSEFVTFTAASTLER